MKNNESRFEYKPEPSVSTRTEIYVIATDADAVTLRGDWVDKEAGAIFALLN